MYFKNIKKADTHFKRVIVKPSFSYIATRVSLIKYLIEITVMNIKSIIFNKLNGSSTHSIKSAITVKCIDYLMINLVKGSESLYLISPPISKLNRFSRYF